ncbi:hypothetical protein LPB41_21720 [Thalassospira sp. MA62]|nr:hypothetical protein [Thalassospira sp. MA62]
MKFSNSMRTPLVIAAPVIAALSLSACGSSSPALDVDVESEEMAEATSAVVGEGYAPLSGNQLLNSISGETFSYRDKVAETNVSITYMENGVASFAWVDDDDDRGMTQKNWTIEAGQYLCLWNTQNNNEDDCARVLSKSGQLATVDNDGNVTYYTQS